MPASPLLELRAPPSAGAGVRPKQELAPDAGLELAVGSNARLALHGAGIGNNERDEFQSTFPCASGAPQINELRRRKRVRPIGQLPPQ